MQAPHRPAPAWTARPRLVRPGATGSVRRPAAHPQAPTAPRPGRPACGPRPRPLPGRRASSGQPARLSCGHHAHPGPPSSMSAQSYTRSIAHSFDRMCVRHCSIAGVRHFCATSNRCLMSGAGSATVTREYQRSDPEVSRWITARKAAGRSTIPPASGPALCREQAKGRPGRKPKGSVPAVVAEMPDHPDPDHVLTWRQRKVLQVIRDSVQRRGYPPFDARDRRGGRPDQHVQRLLPAVHAAEQGLPAARRGPPPHGGGPAAGPSGRPARGRGIRGVRGRTSRRRRPRYVPLVGRIAAGGPLLAEEAIEDVFPLPKQIVGDGTLFLLKVVGDSMINAAIADGDWVVVRQQEDAENGEIVAARSKARRRGHRQDPEARRRRPHLADAAQPGLRTDSR